MSRVHFEGCDCGCSGDGGAAGPVRVHNPPGLRAVAYRVGSHGTFKRALLSALSSSRHPALAELTTRDDDDFSVALLDAFSCMADTLTFYGERFAQESWLRTAEERRSVRELARLVGYRPSPGVAASAFLAFTLEEAPGSPADEVGRTRIPVGTRVQSTPGPDEEPQVYETVEEIEGRVAWNAIRPRRYRRHPLDGSTGPLRFAGLATGLKPGDALLHERDAGGFAFGVVTDVRIAPELGVTDVGVSYVQSPPLRGSVSLAASEPAPGPPADRFAGRTIRAADLVAEAEVQGIDADALLRTLSDRPRAAPRVMVFRARAAVFGHNAPAWDALPLPLRVQEQKYEVKSDGSVRLVEVVPAPFSRSDWIDGKTLAELAGDPWGSIVLDTSVPAIGRDGIVVLRQEDAWAIYRVEEAAEISHAAFNLSAKVTRLRLDGRDRLEAFEARSTTVFGGSEILFLADVPIEEPFAADGEGWTELEGWIPALTAGQRVLVSGPAVDGGEEPRPAVAILDEIEYDLSPGGGTHVRLSPAPSHRYVRPRTTLNANVAPATHGESVEEILGSGDGRAVFQSFVLAQPPLTYVSVPAGDGRRSTLEVRVNEVRWEEAESLHGRGPEERVYVTRQDEEGRTVVQFGDGVTGARLPSGVNNVRASYRKGLGLAGRVGPGRLDMPISRPLGVKGVVNPAGAEGGEDPETLEEARRNAPGTMLTLGRAVSLTDYEDHARTFAGVAKASATWRWTGRRRSVFLSVAAAGGAELTDGGVLHTALRRALAGVGDPRVPLTIASYRKALFRLEATLVVADDHLDEVVSSAVHTALREHFSFARRDFGQPVALSEVVAVMQGVEGVVAVDLDRLHRSDEPPALRTLLTAERPRSGGRGPLAAAEILFLDPAPLDGVRVTS